MTTPHIHLCQACDRSHVCYGMGCTKIDSLCDECADEIACEEEDDDESR